MDIEKNWNLHRKVRNFLLSRFFPTILWDGGMEDSFQAYWVSSCRGALKCLYCCWGKKENVAFNTQSIIFQLLCGFQSYKVEWCVVFFQFTFFPFFLSLLLFAFAFMLHVFPTCFSCLLPLTRFTHFKTLSFFISKSRYLLITFWNIFIHIHSAPTSEAFYYEQQRDFSCIFLNASHVCRHRVCVEPLKSFQPIFRYFYTLL